MTVHWTNTALDHLTAIRNYIARNSPHYAQVVADRIVKRSRQLAQFPMIGATVPEYEDETVREIQEYSFRIIYKVLPERIDIVAVIHGAKRMPRTLPG